MRHVSVLASILLMAFSVGCAFSSQVEREDFVDAASREDYAAMNPDCAYRENILNGEITRGMNGQEVMASWGLPNVYLVSRKKLEEYWVYYVEDPQTSSILIYTLTFQEDNSLADWDIDMKRFTDQSIVYNPRAIRESRTTRSIGTKK